MSIGDLKTKYLLEHTGPGLVSIPVVKLPNYKAVPYHCTEEDVREIISHEENKILSSKLQELKAKEKDIGVIVNDWKSHQRIDRAARALNDLLFPLIFTGEETCSCQNCQNKKVLLHETKFENFLN